MHVKFKNLFRYRLEAYQILLFAFDFCSNSHILTTLISSTNVITRAFYRSCCVHSAFFSRQISGGMPSIKAVTVE